MADTVARMRYMERCSEKFCNIHRNISAPESLLNKVVCIQPANLLKNRLQHRRLTPVYFAIFLRFLKTSRNEYFWKSTKFH